MSLFDFLGQLLVGWLLADLLIGFGHWFGDRIAYQRIPLIGHWLVGVNVDHHGQPLAFSRGTLWQRNRSVWIATAIVGGLWLAAVGFSVVWLAAILGGLVVTEVHLKAHRPPRNRAIRVLQEIGLIQSPKAHARHHAPPHLTRYCILTDWLNPALDELRVWARLEGLLRRLGVGVVN